MEYGEDSDSRVVRAEQYAEGKATRSDDSDVRRDKREMSWMIDCAI